MKLEVTITYRMEITVDDRVRATDIEWAVYRAFDTCDGRQPLSCELATDGVGRIGENIAQTIHSSMRQRIAAKYPATSVARLNSMHMGWSRFDECFKNRPQLYFTPYQTRVVVRETAPDDNGTYVDGRDRLTVVMKDVG